MGRRGPQASNQARIGSETSALPVCPSHLSEAAREIWAEIIPLIPAGLLIKADAPLLASYCQYREQWLRYTEQLAELDPSTPEHRRVTQSANDSHTRLEKCVAELGLSPNSRARMRLEGTTNQKDELDAFLTKGNA